MLDNMHQPVWATGVRIIVDAKQIRLRTKLDVERVPEAGREFFDLRSIRSTADNRSPIAIPINARIVRSLRGRKSTMTKRARKNKSTNGRSVIQVAKGTLGALGAV